MVGAILAGGAGRRMGGAKAARALRGRALVEYAVAALAPVCDPVVVVCKSAAALPPARGWQVWDDEPERPRHPAAGIAHALGRADAAVLVCAADMPFVTSADCTMLLDTAAGNPAAAAVVAEDADGLQPLFGVYRPAAAAPLGAAAERGSPLREAVAALEPVRVSIRSRSLRSVDTPEALAAAESDLASRGA